jgi:hypothetical protein
MNRTPRTSIERQLRSLRAPDEHGAEERARAVVRSVYAERPAPRRQRPLRRFALAPAALLITAALALSPAGAAVHRWIDHTLGAPHASPALFSLPAPGQVLVSGPGGAWTIAADGAKRRLGPWQQASWSPRGIYIAVAAGNELAAVDTRGTPSWTIARPDVSFPRWFGPNGYRIAYLSGTTLRVIAGDGTGDRQLVRQVAPIAPAWRPAHEYQLAYVTSAGAVVVRDADTQQIHWAKRLSSRPQLLAWSANGARLLVLTRDAALLFDGAGRPTARITITPGTQPLDAALSPDNQTLALLSNADVTLTGLPPHAQPTRRIFTGQGLRQLAWSPDSHWLLVSWPAADQWIFIHTTGRPRIAASSRIAKQFSPAGTAHQLVHLDGWCCTSAPPAG